MQFLSFPRRKPITSLAAAIGVFAALLAGYQFLGGMPRFPFSPPESVAPDAPAGISAAQILDGNIVLLGWAPPGAQIRIAEQDKAPVVAVAGESGRWTAMMDSDLRAKNFRRWKMSGDGNTVAQIGAYTAGKPSNSVYVWRDYPAFSLLLAPDIGESGNLYLAIAGQGEDQKPVFAGRAVAGSLVQAYADSDLIGGARASSDGNWTMIPSVKLDRKNLSLRFDEIRGSEGVVERRAYAFGWQDEAANGDNALLHADEDGRKETLLIWKPEAGESLPADEMLAGQILPAQQVKAGR